MIVKKIPARPAGRDATIERAAHARRLVDYLHLPEKESPEKAYMVAYMLSEKLGDTSGERLFHVGGRGFVSTTAEGQRAEMIAVAQCAGRSPNPVDHWLLSWREGELPTAEQIDRTVDIFLDHLGVAGQPCIYACHGDTDNRHLHIALNRYDAAAERMIEINDGWNHIAAHQAVALIVDHFGWQAEAEALYEVVNGQLVLTAVAQAKAAEGLKSILVNAAASELRTGYRSAQRIAQEQALPLIKAAQSWGELHRQLGAIGVTYDATGTNGAVLSVNGVRVRTSHVHKAITPIRLARSGLGPFIPREADVEIKPRDDTANRLPDAFRADEFRKEREAWRAWMQAQKARRIRDRERSARASRPSDIAREEARARQDAKQTEKPRRPAPDLETWYKAHDEHEFARRWRNRLHAEPFGSLSGNGDKVAPFNRSVAGYQPFPCSDGIRYAKGPDLATAFIDRSSRIDVVLVDDEALLAALQLAAVKFDYHISVRGSPEFRERAFEIAQKHGLGQFLTDPDHVARRAELERQREPIRPLMPRPVSISRGPADTEIVSKPGALSTPASIPASVDFRDHSAGDRSGSKGISTRASLAPDANVAKAEADKPDKPNATLRPAHKPISSNQPDPRPIPGRKEKSGKERTASGLMAQAAALPKGTTPARARGPEKPAAFEDYPAAPKRDGPGIG